MDKQQQFITKTENALYSVLPLESASQVECAMAYAVRGGKRVRAVLTLAFGELLGADPEYTLRAACAIEMLHAYSLIHDDLPCMDNDDMRRGQPSTHKAFGEAVALLAGDGLLTKAFETLALIPEPAVASDCVRVLSEAAGSLGMIYGQELDLKYENEPADADTLKLIHSKKTGCLFRACALLAAACAKTDAVWAENAAADIGLTFQIIDDILDCAQEGGDAAAEKSTYVSLYGIQRSRELAEQLTQRFVQTLKSNPGECAFLCEYARQLLKRAY